MPIPTEHDDIRSIVRPVTLRPRAGAAANEAENRGSTNLRVEAITRRRLDWPLEHRSEDLLLDGASGPRRPDLQEPHLWDLTRAPL
jgi:hypothetical protein